MKPAVQIESPAVPPSPRSGIEALLESRLFLFLASVLVVYLHILHNGYECFRSDHMTQIPLIYLQSDKTLFPRDWFLQQFGHFDLRFFHLFLIRLFSAPLGLPGGILALYMVLMVATVYAWGEISRKLYRSPIPGLLTGLMAIYANGSELGTNHLLEKILIPRTEAYAFAYWGLFCLLVSRPFLAGVLMGLSFYCQMAVGAFFLVPMLIWLLAGWSGRGRGRDLKDAAWLLGGFGLLLLYPLLTKSSKLLAKSTISDEEIIRLSGYIRHPHHMIPHLWGWMWLSFAFLVALAGRSWRKLRTEAPQAWALGWMAVIVIAILALSTVFIEVFPIKWVVVGQPFRMAVFLYFVLIMMLAPYVWNLLKSPAALGTARAVCLVMALQDCKFFALMAAIEMLLDAGEKRRRPLPDWAGWLLLALAVGLSGLFDRDLKDIPKMVVPTVLALLLARRYGLAQRPRLLKGLAGAGALAGVLIISSFFWLPYQRWIDDESYAKTKKAAVRCYEYQFNPLPIMALERLGVWADAHTPKDALFLIPPEREIYGFHLWARRSVVFSFKFFPYNPQGLVQWKERFLAMQGILDPETPAKRKAVEVAMNDIGGELVNEAYYRLTVEQALALARRYSADHMITQAQYQHPRMELLHADYNHTKSRKNGKLFYLYRIKKEPIAAAPAGT